MPAPLTQLLSRTVYATDGVTTTWDFSFSGGYLDKAHVKAYIELPTGARTNLTITGPLFTGPYQLFLSPALAAGSTLTIYRDTPKDLPLVDFADEGGLSEIALDTMAKQAIFVAAETTDTVKTSSSYDAEQAADQAATAAAAAVISANAAEASAVTAGGHATSADLSAVAAAATPVAAPTTAAASKATPADSDYIPLIDSAASFILKKLTWVNIKAALKTYFDGFYAGLGANTNITSLSAITSINGGQLAGLRNRIINGGMQVINRAAPSLSASYQYGQVDRMMARAIGATGGTIVQAALAGTSSGFGCGVIAGSWTTGAFAVQHRLESNNVADLNSKTITISCKVYQNSGGARNMYIRLDKPTTLDNHASQIIIGSSGNTSVPSGVLTTLTYTLTLGASDATNGLAVFVAENDTLVTVASKTYLVGDLQLEPGSVATPFEQRPIGMELALCQRYYEVSTNFQLYSGYVNSGSGYYNAVRYQVTKRAIPSVVTLVDSANSGFPASAPTLSSTAADGFNVGKLANATNAAGYYQYSWTSSAEL